MKKNYKTPSVKTVIINNADIICTSPSKTIFMGKGEGSHTADSKFLNIVGSDNEEDEW